MPHQLGDLAKKRVSRATIPSVDDVRDHGDRRSMPSHDAEGYSFDPTLSNSESVLDYLEGLCGGVIQAGVVDAKLFVTGAARVPNLTGQYS